MDCFHCFIYLFIYLAKGSNGWVPDEIIWSEKLFTAKFRSISHLRQEQKKILKKAESVQHFLCPMEKRGRGGPTLESTVTVSATIMFAPQVIKGCLKCTTTTITLNDHFLCHKYLTDIHTVSQHCLTLHCAIHFHTYTCLSAKIYISEW